MRHHPPLAAAVLLLLFLGGMHSARGDDQPPPNDLGKIQPPGGVPLLPGRAGVPLTVDAVNRTSKRLEAAPEADLAKWVAELERITAQKLDSELEVAGCRTYFVARVSAAFDDLNWNARTADNLFQRAQTMPPSEVRAWKKALEVLLTRELERAYVVPLVLIPVEALHEGQKYRAERARKYLARIQQLTADDVSLWQDRVDQFGGTDLDAAVNIILLDDYFDKEKFQRARFNAAVEARKK